VVRSVDRSADHELRGNILFDAPPAKLAYRAYFSYGGHEVQINPPDMPWITAAHQRYSWSFICPDPDTSHNAIDCDLILRPEPNWEKYSKDLEPPWGFEIVLHQLKIAPPVRVAPAAPSR
jgi:hypothetical protein